MNDKVVVVPIGNAGNITAVMNGFLKFFDVGVIDTLAQNIGCTIRSLPTRWSDTMRSRIRRSGVSTPMTVKPSVAQAAMIGNPVSNAPCDASGGSIQPDGRVPARFLRRGGRTGDHGLAVDGESKRPHRHVPTAASLWPDCIRPWKKVSCPQAKRPSWTSTAHALKFSGFPGHVLSK